MRQSGGPRRMRTEQLISENVELRRTAVELALQTSILRENLAAQAGVRLSQTTSPHLMELRHVRAPRPRL